MKEILNHPRVQALRPLIKPAVVAIAVAVAEVALWHPGRRDRIHRRPGLGSPYA